MRGVVHSGVREIPLIVLGTVFLIVFAAPANAQRERDPCRLLSDAEIRASQGHAPAQKIRSEQPSGSFRFTQCFYRTPEYTSSVSVALGSPLETDKKRGGPRSYWQQQFHPPASAAAGKKKKEPPKPVSGLGDEAFWVADPVSGALYVLKGEVFLRVSVGGPRDQGEKIQRARTLAAQALKRIDASAPTPQR